MNHRMVSSLKNLSKIPLSDMLYEPPQIINGFDLTYYTIFSTYSLCYFLPKFYLHYVHPCFLKDSECYVMQVIKPEDD